MIDAAVRDRALGAFVGLAVGDALGTTLEFTRRDEAPHHGEIAGGGPFGLRPGEWTDDTSMALALATSLAERGAYDARDTMGRYVAWWRDGAYSGAAGRDCFDIGNQTRGALELHLATGRAEVGSTAPDMAGNGSIMRLAPAVLHGLPDATVAQETAWRQSLTTHGAPECVEACSFMGALLAARIMGTGDIPVEAWKTPGMQRIAGGAWAGMGRDQVRSTGYVIDTLEAALWADRKGADFEEALVLAVNLGGDADTVGAVTGQVAGARHGLSGIPERWLSTLHRRDELIDIGNRLIDAAPRKRGRLSLFGGGR